MTDKTNTHALPAWTEVEYTALCKNPYLLTPFFIPKEAKCFTCREDGTREEERMVFLVFKSTAAPADAEWEDDAVRARCGCARWAMMMRRLSLPR